MSDSNEIEMKEKKRMYNKTYRDKLKLRSNPDVLAINENIIEEETVTTDIVSKKRMYNKTFRDKMKLSSNPDFLAINETITEKETVTADIYLKSIETQLVKIKAIARSYLSRNKSLRRQLMEKSKEIEKLKSDDMSLDTNKIRLNIPSTPELKSKFALTFQSPQFKSPLSKDLIKLAYVNQQMISSLSKKHTGKKSSVIYKNNLATFVKHMCSLEGEFSKKLLRKEFISYYRNNVFNEQNFSEAMDKSDNSCLSYKSVDSIRKIEIGLKNSQTRLMKSAASTQNYNKDLELGISLMLIEAKVTEKLCQIDVLTVIKQLIASCYALRKYGVTSEDEFRSNFKLLFTIYFTITLDGAKLTEHKSMVIMALGAKIAELTSLLAPNADSNNSKVKSHSHKTYILTAFANTNDDVASSTRIAGGSLKDITELNKTQMIYIDSLQLYFKCAVLIAMDLKAIQICVGSGHASHTPGCFCCFCACQSADRGSANYFKCAACVSKGRSDCYCHTIVRSETISKYSALTVADRKYYLYIPFPKSDDLREPLLVFVKEWLNPVDMANETIEDLLKTRSITVEYLKGKINVAKAVLDQVNVTTIDLVDIDVIRYSLQVRRHEFGSDNYKEACSEFGLRFANNSYKFSKEKTERELLKYLIVEGNLVHYCFNYKKPSMLTNVDFVCICLMHCIMRVSEKLINELVQAVMKTHSDRMQKKIISDIEDIINRKLSNDFYSNPHVAIFAEPSENEKPTNIAKDFLELIAEANKKDDEVETAENDDLSYGFRIKMEDKKANFKISYVRVNKVLLVIDSIIEACQFEEEVETTFKDIFISWLLVKEKLLSEGEFSSHDIESLDEEICKFRKLILAYFGLNIVTNYIHIIIAGHIIEMIKIFGNVAIFSGVGFENLVGRVRNFYFRRTNRSGSKGRGKCLRKKSTAAENVRQYLYRRYARGIDAILKSNPDGDHDYLNSLLKRGRTVNKLIRIQHCKISNMNKAIRIDNFKVIKFTSILNKLIVEAKGDIGIMIAGILESEINKRGLNSDVLLQLCAKFLEKSPSHILVNLINMNNNIRENREKTLKQFSCEIKYE